MEGNIVEEQKGRYISVLEQRLSYFNISIRDYGKTDIEVRSGIEAFMEEGCCLESSHELSWIVQLICSIELFSECL